MAVNWSKIPEPSFSKILEGANKSLVSLLALETNFMKRLPMGSSIKKIELPCVADCKLGW